MLEDRGIEGVIMVRGRRTDGDMMMKGAEKGKQMFVEKPVRLRVEECRGVCEKVQ
ncbi:Gfo/Idh/MocA family oxidoreductase, partial [Bacillus subtilis]|uniref:Gfo/Idh/MocA family oxidoreductase n=1 Tax=Bacillus subtilis TaxID=1423 RepID=UPI002545D9DA